MKPLQNSTLRIAVLNDSLFAIDRLSDGTIVGRSGLNFLVIETLALLLGFSYKIFVPADGQYGLPTNGTWNGAVGMLIKDEVDLAALSFYVTAERKRAINFSITINHDNIVHVTRADSSVGGGRPFVSQPFQDRVWIFIYSAVILFLFVQLSIRVLLPKYYFTMKTLSLWNVLSFTIGLGNWKYLDVTGLILASMTIFVGSTLKMYGSTLASSVNLIKRAKPFDTIDELSAAVKLNRMSLGYLETQGIIHTCLKTSKLNQLREFGAHLDAMGDEREKPFPAAFHSLMSSDFALIVDVQYFVMSMEKRKHSLSKVNVAKEPLIKINMAYGYGRSFEHRKLLNQALGRLRSFGLMDKFESNEMFFLKRDLDRAARETRNKVQYIGMDDLRLVLRLFFAAKCVIFLLFIFEYINGRIT